MAMATRGSIERLIDTSFSPFLLEGLDQAVSVFRHRAMPAFFVAFGHKSSGTKRCPANELRLLSWPAPTVQNMPVTYRRT
jgi:hypothetical protein